MYLNLKSPDQGPDTQEAKKDEEETRDHRRIRVTLPRQERV